MATRTVILSVVLVMSLIMAQSQVDAWVWCPSITARFYFNICLQSGRSEAECASANNCEIVEGAAYPGGYSNYDILKKSADAMKEYCNLGCVYSSCGALTTLQNSDPSAIVNGAVERCTKACSTICTKGSMTAVETA